MKYYKYNLICGKTPYCPKAEVAEAEIPLLIRVEGIDVHTTLG